MRNKYRPHVLFAATEIFATGGIQRFNRNLLDAWQKCETDVTVLTLNESYIDDAVTKNYPGFTFLVAKGNKLLFAWFFFSALIKKKYDRIVCGHLHLASLTFLCAATTLSLSKTTVILHGVETWGRIRGITSYFLRYIKQVLAVSSYTRQSFLEQVSTYEPSNCIVFPNTLSQNLHIDSTVSARYVSGPFRILSVTRLSRSEKDKGLREVMSALQTLKDIDYEYLVVGEGDDKSALMAHAEELGIACRVSFRGRLGDEELWHAYEQAHSFVLPSKKEGFGIVFLEAMRFGIPVIAAAEKGALDVIEHEETGLLVEYGNVQEIAAAIKRLVLDRPLREKLCEQGFTLIAPGGKFSFEAFCHRTQQHLC